MDIPHRRDTDVTQRLDAQDLVLGELRAMMLEHKITHTITDPAVLELVDILKGAKLLKRLAIVIASIVGGVWAFFAYVWEHFHFTK